MSSSDTGKRAACAATAMPTSLFVAGLGAKDAGTDKQDAETTIDNISRRMREIAG
jgi:hypothetical protein